MHILTDFAASAKSWAELLQRDRKKNREPLLSRTKADIIKATAEKHPRKEKTWEQMK